MLERANRAARGLRELGIEHDDAIAVLLRNDFPFFEAAYAANRLGVHLVPINWHFSAPEVAYILEDSGAKALSRTPTCSSRSARRFPASVRVFVVETPPEIATAYSIAPARGRRGARTTPSGASGCAVRTAAAGGGRVARQHDLHVRNHRPPERRAAQTANTGRSRRHGSDGRPGDGFLSRTLAEHRRAVDRSDVPRHAERLLPPRDRYELDAGRRTTFRRAALSRVDRPAPDHPRVCGRYDVRAVAAAAGGTCASVATSVR